MNQIIGWLLVALGVHITVQSLYTLIVAESKPEPSYLGIGLLLVAAVVMPTLACPAETSACDCHE